MRLRNRHPASGRGLLAKGRPRGPTRRLWSAVALLVLSAATFTFLLEQAPSPTPGTQPARYAVPSSRPIKVPFGTTIVSFTFDDGFKGQEVAARILNAHGMKGTFYIIDGNVDYPAYMTWTQIRAIARRGNEIGGHTVHHPNLDTIHHAQAVNEVCDDRATLLQMGFHVTDFAYPYGGPTDAVKTIPRRCGYNSARDVSGLWDPRTRACGGCPFANRLPESDPFRIRGNTSTTLLPSLKTWVRQGEQRQRSFVPLIFHHICTQCASRGDERISPADFTKLVEWIQTRRDVKVATVQQVMGGPVRPAVGTPVRRSLELFDGTVHLRAPTHIPAWVILGLQVGQTQILYTGLFLLGTAALLFRILTRGSRYAP